MTSERINDFWSVQKQWIKKLETVNSANYVPDINEFDLMQYIKNKTGKYVKYYHDNLSERYFHIKKIIYGPEKNFKVNLCCENDLLRM